MPGLGMMELALILVLALIFFGPGKLPGVGQALGKTMKEFRKATNEEPDRPAEAPKAVEPARPGQN